MNEELVHFYTTDSLKLPGLLYSPKEKTDKIAIYLHGNGTSSVFYKPEMNLYGEELAKKGISFFPFNNRGAHLIKSLKRKTPAGEERAQYGTAYELIKECIIDIDSAISYLKTLGYTTFYLIGESTGANKIVVYNYYKPQNEVSKYILLSGGDDTGLYYDELGKEQFNKLLKLSKEKVEEGKGAELIPLDMFSSPMSYQSMYDTINPDGDYNIFPYNETFNKLQLSTKELFREFKTIHKPTLVVYGDLDEYCYGRVNDCVEILKKQNTSQQYEIIPEADHGFSGKEKELIQLISNFLTK